MAPRFWKKKWFIAACALFGVWLVIRLIPLPVPGAYSQLIIDDEGRILRASLTPEQTWRFYTPISKVSPNLIRFVIAYEDRYFRYHPGINPAALWRAFKENKKAGRVVQGGSTLTMQLSRLLLQNRKRSYWNKIQETLLAFLLEIKYSKNEILELYLNLVPFGGNIQGVGAAAQLYFNKSPSEISYGEAAFLTMLPKSPTAYRPDKNFDLALKNRNKVIALLTGKGVITEKEKNEALAEPLVQGRLNAPFEAPHFCDWVSRIHGSKREIYTTLNRRIQQTAESVAADFMRGLAHQDIENCAVVVMRNDTGELKAMVGSKDFFDAPTQGQVNGALAPRSPGSLLKPFLYALGVDQGQITPKKMLFDVPVSYAGYTPENFDERYRGAVTMQNALRLSLNVPAVNIYAEMREQGLFEFLRQAGITTLNRPKEYYGLPLILGACEVNLLEMVNVYSVLANQGVFKPVRSIQKQKGLIDKRRLLSESSAWMITDILTDLERPDLPEAWESTTSMPRVAWKTGTSYGYKDAWSIGYNPLFTIGVWVGNFDGHGAHNLVGAKAAAPLLFRMFDALTRDSEGAWFAQPDDVQEREVCALTGSVPNEHCPTIVKDTYYTQRSASVPCNVHQILEIDKQTGARLCPVCRGDRPRYEKLYQVWPAQVATQLKLVRYPVPSIPTHFSGCRSIQAGSAPTIVSPEQNVTYFLGKNLDPKNQKILLAASVQNSVKKVFWFVNKQLMFQGSPEDRFFLDPVPGEYRIVLMDEDGRVDRRLLKIF